jgi:hypothetical protein
MKLGQKLLAAPLLTALVMLSAGQINAVLSAHHAAAERKAEQARSRDLKTVSSLMTNASRPSVPISDSSSSG